MAQFAAVFSCNNNVSDGNVRILRDCLHKTAADLAIPVATDSVMKSGFSVEFYPRLNATGSGIVRDFSSESWLLSIGTWFHSSGINVGNEEKLLDMLLTEGASKVSAGFDGFFNIVFYDGVKKTLTVFSDIIGSCFCFYRRLNDCFVISSSSLLLAKMAPASIDTCGCQEFISTGIIYGDKSFFKEVRRLDAASIVTFSHDNMTSVRYWNISSIPDRAMHGNSTAKHFKEALCGVLKRVSSVFDSQVCDFTGGMDSRVLLAGYLINKEPPDTVVVGENKSADVVISKKIADILGLSHTHLHFQNIYNYENLHKLLSITDGELDLIEYLNIFNVHSLLAKKYNISVGGSFGEVGKGYWWELLFPQVGKREKLDTLLVSEKRFAPRAYIDFFGDCSEEKIKLGLKKELDSITHDLQKRPNTLQMDSCYLNMRMRCWQGRIATSTNRIWPCLSPLMFRSILELLMNVEPRVRTGSRLYRCFLRDYSPTLANQPLENGTIAAPLTLFNFLSYSLFIRSLFGKVLRRVFKRIDKDDVKNKYIKERLLRKKILEDYEIARLMSIEKMSLAEVMDKTVLSSFLDDARNSSEFKYNAEWQRILSLEFTLKNLRLKPLVNNY